MTTKHNSLVDTQHRKMLFTLLAYLVSGTMGLLVLLSLPFNAGIIVAPLVAFGLGWWLTRLVHRWVQPHCPVCDSNELTENFTLQCRLPEFQCERCQQRFVGGK
jgi:predicted membrane channel-forming protein YqfA (hemolysin III family)